MISTEEHLLRDKAARMGWKVVACQNIPKVDEVTARMFVALVQRHEEWPEAYHDYIVYTFNVDDQAFYFGDYHSHRSEAWYAFGERVLRYWPKWQDEPVPEDAPEDFFKQMMTKAE